MDVVLSILATKRKRTTSQNSSSTPDQSSKVSNCSNKSINHELKESKKIGNNFKNHVQKVDNDNNHVQKVATDCSDFIFDAPSLDNDRFCFLSLRF